MVLIICTDLAIPMEINKATAILRMMTAIKAIMVVANSLVRVAWALSYMPLALLAASFFKASIFRSSKATCSAPLLLLIAAALSLCPLFMKAMTSSRMGAQF